ncbi:MAG: sialate O-acetylesterase [Pirellulaceae bacterium]|nr:sialate O-acetylesterase [Pirellulaceae bacterium]
MITRITVLLLAALSMTTYTIPEAQAQKKPGKLQIFILAGQSNMEGKGSAETMNRQIADPQKRMRFQHLKNGDQWVERDDVWIDYLGNRGQRYGKLTMGYGISQKDSQKLFGPELGFGWAMGDLLDDDILIIKTAWGGKSLDRDFRSPSRGIPASIDEVVKGQQKRKPELTKEEYEKGYGHFYRLMMQEVKLVLGDLQTYAPEYQNQGYEIAGFVWFQGWNDQYAPTSVADYEENMAGFIRDIRKDLKRPDLPVVIGAMGHQGANQKGKIRQIADAQAAVAEQKEFQDSVTTIRTADYWDTEAESAFKTHWADQKNRDIEKWRNFGNDRPYHYLGSPVFFYNVGVAFAEAMYPMLSK